MLKIQRALPRKIVHFLLGLDPNVFSIPSVRLFQFSSAELEFRGDSDRPRIQASGDACVVPLEIDTVLPTPNDLVSRLSSILVHQEGNSTMHSVIREPSEVVAFHLKSSFSSSHGTEGFSYPKSIYMDQFLAENLGLAIQKRKEQQMINTESTGITQKKKTVTNYNVGHLSSSVVRQLESFINVNFRIKIHLRTWRRPYTTTSIWLPVKTMQSAVFKSRRRLKNSRRLWLL